MDPTENDHAGVRLPPPLVFLTLLLAGVALQRFVIPLPVDLPLAVRLPLSGVSAIAGLALIITAFLGFRATDQNPKPWTPTPEIVSSGIYRLSRNPMYVGMALLQAAIGIGIQNPWIVALTPVSLSVVYLTAIRLEETYLEQKFGNAYKAYKRSVRRWI